MKIDVEIDDRAVVRALNGLAARARDMGPAMRAIAGHLEDGVADALENQAAPDGTPWAPLAESTRGQRERAGYPPDKPILERTGDLFASVSSRWTPTQAVATVSQVYARVHQFGAEAGEFGADASGRPLPWGDIPARPFLGLSDDTREAILEDLARHLAPDG